MSEVGQQQTSGPSRKRHWRSVEIVDAQTKRDALIFGAHACSIRESHQWLTNKKRELLFFGLTSGRCKAYLLITAANWQKTAKTQRKHGTFLALKGMRGGPARQFATHSPKI
jgi:hypothetical protein